MRECSFHSLFSRKRRNYFILAFSIYCFAAGTHPSAHAFFGKKNTNKPSKHAAVSDASKYRVYYTYDNSTLRQDPETGKPKQWVELNYKVVNMNEEPGAIFPGSEGGKVRFLDKEGFAIAADYFLNKDFQGTDLYGLQWVDRERAALVVRAEVVPLKPGEMETLQREKAQKIAEKKQEEEAWQAALGKIVPSPLPMPSITPVVEVSPSPSPTVFTSASVQPEVNKIQEPDRGNTEKSEGENSKEGIAASPSSVAPESTVSPLPSPNPENSPSAAEFESLKPSIAAEPPASAESMPVKAEAIVVDAEVRSQPTALPQPSVSESASPASDVSSSLQKPENSPLPTEAKSIMADPIVIDAEIVPGAKPKQLIDLTKMSMPVASSPAASPNPETSGGLTTSASPSISPSASPEAQNNVTAPATQDKMSPSKEKKNEVLDLGGVKNDEILDALTGLNKKPPTQVPDSPSTIPGLDEAMKKKQEKANAS